MAISSTYLSNPSITINSVDLTDQCTSAVINYVSEQLENTTFSNTSRSSQLHFGSVLEHRHRDPLPVICRK
jgi:hypothetical protein